MFGSNLFQWLSGEFYNINALTTDLPITEADPDAATGFLQRGKMVNYKANDITKLAFTTGNAMGILTRNISLNGINNDEGFKNFTIGLTDLPLRRGLAATVRVPNPNAQAIFEGSGAASYDTLVITATTTGYLSSSTARGTQLTVEKGGWRTAQSGEFVLAILEQANYTPYTGGNVRIRVRFTAPYKLVVDTVGP